jgi:hypothetical protein
MTTRAYGRMVFWEGASLWILGTRPGEGPYPKTDFHAHHAVQVTLSLRGWFQVESRERDLGDKAAAAAVAPDTEHAFSGEGLIAHLFIDPEGQPGRVVQRTWLSTRTLISIAAEELGDLPGRLRSAFEAPRRNDKALIDLGRALLARLAPGSERDERPGGTRAPDVRMGRGAARYTGEPRRCGLARRVIDRPRAPSVRRGDRAAVSHLLAVAAPEPRGRAVLGRLVAHRGRARRRLLRFLASQSHVPAHVRHRRGLAARHVALSFKCEFGGRRIR